MLRVRHASGPGRRGMRVDTVATRIGDRNRDVNQFLGQRIELCRRGHQRLDFRPCSLQQRRIKRKEPPQVIDEVGFSDRTDVVKHSFDT